jgi:hypothetical protein
MMRFLKRISLGFIVILMSQSAFSQINRIKYNNQNLFLSGANLAWVSFAGDVGTGTTDTNRIADTFLSMHNHGGNAIRWWIHTDGTSSPQFIGSRVVGPGSKTIPDIKRVLDIAWDREIGINLCLWSFDMLRATNSSAVLARNRLLLTDTNYTRYYINSCLIPMVTALKGHPALLSYEIFNEPEGMSTEFSFGGIQTVAMSDIQRFINLCAGAIHRTDPNALVTNGAWSFISLSDIQTPLSKANSRLSRMSAVEKQQMETQFYRKYQVSLTADQILQHFATISTANYNYYLDSRLIAAGGDSAGVLDFYSVHYYNWAGNNLCPMIHKWNAWGLSKPIVVAEFSMEQNNGAVPRGLLFDTLYQLGYAGALPWSWTDTLLSSPASMLSGMQYMWDHYRQDVDVHGIAFSFPSITITNPPTGASYPDSTSLTFMTTVSDTMPITFVTFYADTTKIGEVTTPYNVSADTSFFTFQWKSISPGSYAVTAIATNSGGHQRASNIVVVSTGLVPMTKIEAESAAIIGDSISVKIDNTASNKKFIDIGTANTNSSVTWKIINYQAAGTYPLTICYKLNYASPKSQYLNINGVRVDTVEFTAASISTWYQKNVNINLIPDTNTIQLGLFWGWMYLDYIALPTSIVTSVATPPQIPLTFSLEQNYPNPFNPATTISFSIAKSSNVKLVVYNLLGQKVATLADKYMEPATYSFKFDAARFASGVYFYRLEAGEYRSQKKMLLLK